MPRSQRALSTQRLERLLADRAAAKGALDTMNALVAEAMRTANDAGITQVEISRMARDSGWGITPARVSQLVTDARHEKGA